MRKNYIIYGRKPCEIMFRAMGDKGQVLNLIYAIVYWNYAPARLFRLQEQCDEMKRLNPEWSFELRARE